MAEKRTIELEIQDNSKSLKAQYKEAVAELQKVSAQYGETSEQAIKAAKAAAELKDQIGFSKDLVEAFNPDAKFKAVEGAVNGVLNGFQAFTGGMALLGVESEKVQEALLKVQSVMALTQGINGLMEARDSFKQLGTVAANALKGIKTGIAATGIGLLLVAVGTLVAYWDDIKEAVSGVSDEQKDLNKQTEKNVTLENEKLNALDSQDNLLKLQGKTEKQILELKIKQIDLVIAATEEQLKQNQITAKAQEEATLRNFNIAKQVISVLLKIALIPVTAMIAQIDLLIKGANFVSEALGGGKLINLEPLKEANKFIDSMAEGATKFLFDPEQVKADGLKIQKETEKQLVELKNKRAGYVLAIRNIDQQGARDQQKIEKEKLDLTRQRIDEEIKLMEDGYEKEKRILEENAKREKEDLAKSIEGKIYDAKEYAKTQKLIEDNLTKDLKELRSKYFDDELKARGFSIEALKNDKIKELEIEVAANEEKARIQKEYDEKEKARIKQLNQDKLQLAKDGLQLVSDLASLFGQQDEKKARLAFQVDKAAKISSATIAGYEAVLEAYKTGQKSPLTAVFPAYPYIQAGLAGAFAAVNIAKIGKAKFQSSGGGGGSMSPAGAGGGAAPMTANFNTIGSSGINQLAQLQQTPTQAYVVSGEVTSAQALDRNRVQNATL
jgi:hypothetical protein